MPGLCAIVCGQQLSTASAAAIRGRLFAAFDPFHHDTVRLARGDKLARLGLSQPKIKSIKEIGKAIAKRHIDLDAVADMEADEAHAALTALHGIGPWTADIYLLFCLGHADAWPAGDLALQEAARIAFGLQQAARRQGDGEARRSLAAVARRGGASVVGLLSRGEAARGRAGASRTKWPAVTQKAKDRKSRTEQPMAGELDGPRLEPPSGTGQAPGRVPARLRRRRQRPDRHRPRLAGAAAGRRLRLAARAASRAARRRPGGNGFRCPSASRTSAGTASTRPRPVLEHFLDAELARRKLPPSALALVGFSQGTMMALHVGLRRAVPPAAIVGYSGMLRAAGQGRTRSASPARSRRGRRCCWSTATRTSSFRCRRCSMARRRSPRSKCRSNGTSRRRRPRHRPGRPAPRRRIPRPRFGLRPERACRGLGRAMIRAQPARFARFTIPSRSL